MQKNYYYIANWKIYFSYSQAVAWCNENKEQLQELAKNKKIVICPSYDSLVSVAQIFEGTLVALGAQNCSEHLRGAYTGQVTARSLQEIGISYCIIGHSEARASYGDSNRKLKEKLLRLNEQGIIPLFCIGESLEEYQQKKAYFSIERQLEPIISFYDTSKSTMPCFIAYEPVWAIGTGVVARSGHITQLLAIVRDALKACSASGHVRYIYGGSVTSQTITQLKKIEFLDGFLIGKASTDFQELKKIVV